MIPVDFIRWFHASVNDFFVTGITAQNLQNFAIYIEGQEVELADAGLTSWAELHVTGPDIVEEPENCFTVHATLTIMCTAVYTTDEYLLQRVIGQFANLVSSSIPIYKRGTPGDNSFISCLQPTTKTRTMPWGPIEIKATSGSLRVKAMSLEQEYKMIF